MQTSENRKFSDLLISGSAPFDLNLQNKSKIRHHSGDSEQFFLTLPSQNIFIQSQPWKHQNSVWNMFKVWHIILVFQLLTLNK